jgi:hypothetical protein
MTFDFLAAGLAIWDRVWELALQAKSRWSTSALSPAGLAPTTHGLGATAPTSARRSHGLAARIFLLTHVQKPFFLF